MNTINNRWFGVLTPKTMDGIAAVVRDILKGRFCIAEALYCDSPHTDLRLISADCRLDSRWTSAPETESVRVFPEGEEEHAHPWFGFSAGGYLWGFHPRPDDKQDHENFRYPYFNFEGDKFTVTERAPAGHLHQRVFGAHREKAEEA